MLEALSRNLAIKITSLALAVLLWAMVAGQREVVREVRVPLVLPELPDSLVYLVAPPAEVAVTFRASGRRLFWLRLRAPRLRPGFTPMASEEPMTLSLSKDYLDLPRQFSGSVLGIQPATVSIQAVALAEKEVPVKVVVGKEPRHPYGFTVGGEPRAVPATIRARGPREIVGRMPWVRTAFLDLSDAVASGTREVALEVTDSLITYSPGRVQVSYEIEAWEPD